MKTSLLLTIIGTISFLNSYCQPPEQYFKHSAQAWEFYQANEFQKSAEEFEKAFKVIDGKAYPTDRYNAACSHALANNPERAFFHLFRLAESKTKYNDYNHISVDTDLNSLHEDKRWDRLLTIVKANKEEYEKDFDKELVAQLDTIYQLDQKYRMQIREIEEKHGRDSDEMKAHWALIQKTDSINLIKVKKILDERGWLGTNVIGKQGNSTLFLVIQHAELETQLHYLPMMREAVKVGNANAASLALLEDRVALRQGKKQIYGSQIGRDQKGGEFYVSPLIEPEKVNERRAEVGLGTIEDYVKNWNIKWDVEKHKKEWKKNKENYGSKRIYKW